MNGRQGSRMAILGVGMVMLATAAAEAHYPHYPNTAATAEDYRELAWKSPFVSRVLTQGWVDTLGLSFIWPRPEAAEVKRVDGRNCLVGGFFSFDVADGFAFDVDETIELELEFEAATGPAVIVDYDRNGATRPPAQIDLPQDRDTRWRKVVVRLERARFANLGQYGTDIAIASPGAAVTADPTVAFDPSKPHNLVLCGLTLRRTHTTPAHKDFGWATIEVRDEYGAQTPARVGIYDATGRAPLPAKDALPVQRYGDTSRFLRLRDWGPGRTEPWPNENRQVFFVSGQYRTRLPAGRYDVIVSKGPEYRVVHTSLTVNAEAAATAVVHLDRASDVGAKGWVSGDDHMHFDRHSKLDDAALLTLASAEDINIMNLLQMGNLTDVTFRQYAFGEQGRAQDDKYTLVPGQEDPRSGQRGHTLHLNIKQAYRDQEYFAYHKVFEEMRRQGAVSGYAHFGEGHFNEWRGMAVDAPFGLVDIVEVLQFGALNLDLWYDFLNLGFKISPAAGSDWPYGNLPGAERIYVQSHTVRDVDVWYRNLKAGRLFVTNGPMLDFAVNGQPPGTELHLKRGDKVTIRAAASQNTDYDTLERLEIVVNGEVVARTTELSGDGLHIAHELHLEHGMWVAVRAYGRDYTKAHSAPVYIVADGDPSWRRQDVPALVAKMREAIRALLAAPSNALLDLEYWQTHGKFSEEWKRQLPQLKLRVEAADKFYADLEERARSR